MIIFQLFSLPQQVQPTIIKQLVGAEKGRIFWNSNKVSWFKVQQKHCANTNISSHLIAACISVSIIKILQLKPLSSSLILLQKKYSMIFHKHTTNKFKKTRKIKSIFFILPRSQFVWIVSELLIFFIADLFIQSLLALLLFMLAIWLNRT